MEKPTQQYDVCIVCALDKETRAVLHVVEEQCHTAFTERISPRYQYTFRAATILNHQDEPLELHLSWLPGYGPQQMIRHLTRVLEEYQPRLVLMTGICAGDAQQVQLGDLIVAERVFTYDNGKFTRDKRGRTVYEHDVTTYQLNLDLLQYLRLFNAWESLVMGLERPSLPSHQFSRSQVRRHIRPMASGSAVRADRPFEEVRVPVRDTVAIDMESAALGMVMSDHPSIPWLVVKGVCDYADAQKDDTYHDFAARASALYALSFLQHYVTRKRLPPRLFDEKHAQFLNVPRRNPLFTGRSRFLEELHKTLQLDHSVVLYAISGMGGIGKTQAAAEYAYRFRNDYDTVFWVKADADENILSSFTTLVDSLGLLEKRERTPQAIIAAVKAWFESHPRWLLIFDNADELNVLPDFLPHTLEQGQHILLTTRDSAPRKIGATAVKIDIMTEDEGSLFLLRRTGKLIEADSLADASEDDRSDARKIVEALRGLPLALEQAGAYIESTGISMKEYLDRFQTYRLDLLKRFHDKPPDYNYTVATTWAVSFERVKEENPAAAELLRLCAFLDPDAIQEEMIAGRPHTLGPMLGPLSSNELRMDEMREELLRFSLVRRNSSTKTLTIHRLVQDFIQDGMGDELRRIWAERAIRTVNEAFPKKVNEVKTWDQCQRYLPHALACAGLVKKYGFVFLDAAQLLNQVGYYLREQARYKEAEEYLQQALATGEQLGSEHDIYKVTILNSLARLYFDTYQYAKATPLYEQALAIREQKLEPDHPVIAQGLNSLALSYWYEKKLEQAEPLYERALRISLSRLEMGPEDNQTLLIQNNQALLYRSQRKYKEAIELNLHVLGIRKRKFGPDNPEVVQFLQNSKEPYYQYPVNPEVAQSLQNLGVTYYYEQLEQEQADLSKYEEAERLLKRTLAIREIVYPKNHLQISRCLNYLALVYQVQKKYKEAAQPFKRALDIIEEHLGKGIPQAISIAKNYHTLLQRLIPELSDERDQLEISYKNLSHVDLDSDE